MSKSRATTVALVVFSTVAVAASAAERAAFVEVSIVEPGVYRIAYDDLAELGAEVAEPESAALGLSNAGKAVPIWIEDGGDGRFGPGDWLEFVGDRLPGEIGFFNEHSPVNVYALRWDTAGTPRVTAAARPKQGSAGGCKPEFSVVRHLEEDRLLLRFAGRGRDQELWYWAKLSNLDKKPFQQWFALDNLDLGAARPVIVRVRLRGWSHPWRKADPNLADHRVDISVNGVHVESVEWEGQDEAVAEFQLPVGSCRPADNHIELRVPKRVPEADGDPLIDVVVLNWIEISYPRHGGVGRRQVQIAIDDSCDPLPDRLFTPTKSEFVIYGGGVRLDRTAMLRRELSGGGNLHFFHSPTAADLDRSTIWVVPDGRSKHPAAMELRREAGLRSTKNRADYIMIAHPRLLEAVEPLADLHRERGLSVQVVDVNNIYSEFNHGILHPRAIRDFLSFASDQWAPPAPRFVLLVGDASWDPKNEEVRERNYVAWTYSEERALAFPATSGSPYEDEPQLNNRNLVPTWNFMTAEGHAASDNYFVSFGEDEGRPDMAIGRFPVTEPDEVSAIVDKTLRYVRDAGGGPWRKRILWISDGDSKQNRISDNLEETFSAIGYSGSKFKPQGGGDAGAEHRSNLVQAIDDGPFLVHFIGHGGRFIWRTAPADLEANRDLFTLEDVDRLQPDTRLPIVLSMTCYSAPFDHPSSDSIGEKFLRVPGKGAVAVIAASWRVAATEHTSQRLIEEIFGSQTIGEALLEAKRSSGHRDFIHIFNLLGDPALPVSEAGERSDRSREQIRAPRPADSR